MAVHDRLGPRLRALRRSTDQMMTDELAQMDLTAAQGNIIGYLCHRAEPACAQDVAEVFRLSGATVSGILQRLESKGFIAFYPDPRDRRCKRIAVQPKADAVFQRIAQVICAHEKRMVEGFTEEERRQFAAFLDRAIDNMGGGGCRCGKKEEQ